MIANIIIQEKIGFRIDTSESKKNLVRFSKREIHPLRMLVGPFFLPWDPVFLADCSTFKIKKTFEFWPIGFTQIKSELHIS